MKKGVGFAHGTFGELVQGALRGKNNQFLVTLPIATFSKAEFTLDETTSEITVCPQKKYKALDLVKKLLDHFDLHAGGKLTIESDLVEGKGLASSSADLVATARAVELALDRLVPVDLIMALLRTIEPTDGVMYSDFVSFFHRRINLCRRLGYPSRLKLIAIDEGGHINTVEYNHRNHLFSDAEYEEYASLLVRASSAISNNDLELLGRVATRSAVMNQKRNPKLHLKEVIAIGKDTGALGVVVTHSGPCIALMYPYNPAEYQRQYDRAEARLHNLGGAVFSVESLSADCARSKLEKRAFPPNYQDEMIVSP